MNCPQCGRGLEESVGVLRNGVQRSGQDPIDWYRTQILCRCGEYYEWSPPELKVINSTISTSDARGRT